MSGIWRTLALVVAVAAVGAAGTLAAAAVTGMDAGDLAHLVAFLVPAAAVTVVAAVAADPSWHARRCGQRFVGVALVAAVAALANLWALTSAMFVSDHDATLLAVLLIYAAAAGVGAALVLGEVVVAALERLSATARRARRRTPRRPGRRAGRRPRARCARRHARRDGGATGRRTDARARGRDDATRPDDGRLARPSDAPRLAPGDGGGDRRRRHRRPTEPAAIRGGDAAFGRVSSSRWSTTCSSSPSSMREPSRWRPAARASTRSCTTAVATVGGGGRREGAVARGRPGRRRGRHVLPPHGARAAEPAGQRGPAHASGRNRARRGPSRGGTPAG